MKIKEKRRHVDDRKSFCSVFRFVEESHAKDDAEDVEWDIQELKQNVDETSRSQETMTSHDQWIDEISEYDNVERLKNLLNERKIFHEHQKKKDVVCDDSIDLSDLHDESIIWWERARKVDANNMRKRWSNEGWLCIEEHQKTSEMTTNLRFKIGWWESEKWLHDIQNWLQEHSELTAEWSALTFTIAAVTFEKTDFELYLESWLICVMNLAIYRLITMSASWCEMI